MLIQKIVHIIFNSMTNIKNSDSNLLSIDQVLFKKKNTDCIIYEISAKSLYLFFQKCRCMH